MTKNITPSAFAGFLKTASLLGVLAFSLNGGDVRASELKAFSKEEAEGTLKKMAGTLSSQAETEEESVEIASNIKCMALYFRGLREDKERLEEKLAQTNEQFELLGETGEELKALNKKLTSELEDVRKELAELQEKNTGLLLKTQRAEEKEEGAVHINMPPSSPSHTVQKDSLETDALLGNDMNTSPKSSSCCGRLVTFVIGVSIGGAIVGLTWCFLTFKT